MIAICLIWIGIGIYYGNNTKITKIEITNNNISRDYKIVFISDMHVDAIHQHNYISNVVKKIITINPDFILLGGDLVNSAVSGYDSVFEPFNQLNIPIYATLGNHDHM
jgi:predicted MPP superfamily phosphohydrolase